MSILGKHVGHRAWIVDDKTIKCVDCVHTLDLTPRQSLAGSTSPTPSPLGVNDAGACPLHVGQHADACGLCRAETLEANRPLHLVKGSDPTSISEWQKARERFGSKRKPGEAS